MPPQSLHRLVAIAPLTLSILLAACGSEGQNANDAAEPQRSGLQFGFAQNQYDWGDTMSNPGRTAELPNTLSVGDWPGFRGARRDGIADSVTFGTDWATDHPKELWRRRVGVGRSSFTVIGDYVFTQEQRGPNETVVCYEADTGTEVWVSALADRFNHPKGDGPRATPTFANGRLYTQGATGLLQCLDAATGAVVWRKQLQDETAAKIPHFGFASSPLVVDDLVTCRLPPFRSRLPFGPVFDPEAQTRRELTAEGRLSIPARCGEVAIWRSRDVAEVDLLIDDLVTC